MQTQIWYIELAPSVDENHVPENHFVSDSAYQSGTATGEPQLPEFLRPYFWDRQFDQIDFALHRDFVVGRVLAEGDWNAVTWLRRTIGDAGVREWIIAHGGRELDPQQLSFWELIVDLPTGQVAKWLAERGHGWDDRFRR